MTVVLDSGALSMLARNRARLEELRRRGEWPALVPAVVLTEALTGDRRRDFHQNRILRTCDIHSTDDALARQAARLRTAARARSASAVDAVVVALADEVGGAAVLTADGRDLRALATHAANDVRVHTV
ncbi:MAG TPA: hypothetical protein VFJ85_05130 [Acidimicrobiales bacterium]|nr:hypothetical protein [Acidimicrobiales bacterium]